MCCIHFYFSIESDLSGEFQYLNETWAEKQGLPCFSAHVSCIVFLLYVTTIPLALMLERLFEGGQTALYFTALL